ncbi:class I SAM-dependent methyltransferase [Aureimonas sp. ME7]|uniref:class I SAM-dependent methyltransferase n=1 Tax=Aureimonas sp. ME7 TaxID=2744252 RepID=UPI0015F5EAF5|nr:class I SAM-dependent methyltransferase [Aureimonas sp. ME7]
MRNFDLKEDIRDYWSERSETFDLSAGHRIAPGAEAEAWAAEIGARLGPAPLRILELACGTGEITGVLHALGHEIVALDFSEAMLARAQAKHAGQTRLRFTLADAERTMEAGGAFDAVVCRHLVWTLTDPAGAFREWRRVLRPGGTLLVFDGDWARVTGAGRLARIGVRAIDRWRGEDGTHRDGMADRHAAIMRELPFGTGLRLPELLPLLTQADFGEFRAGSQNAIGRAQRQGASLRDRLRTLIHRRFVLAATAL